ncbi:HPr family phosphocarrier protein [Planctomycetes bacterium Poly30]
MTAKRVVQVVNPAGLHARPCHAIVSTALEFPCSLRIRHARRGGEVGDGDPGVNGKSILELMTLEASMGSSLEFLAEGDGQDELLERLEALVQRGFGEI